MATFYSNRYAEIIYGDGLPNVVTYADVHDHETGIVRQGTDAATPIEVYQQAYNPPKIGYYTYRIARGFFYFDTSSIPEGSVITALQFRYYVQQAYQTTGRSFNIAAQTGENTYPNNPAVEGDFLHSNYSGEEEKALGGDWETLTFSADAYSWVNAGGETRIAVRIDKDVDSDAPPTPSLGACTEGIRIRHTTIGGINYYPRLVILYEEPPAISVTTQAATEIGYQAAMGNGTIVSSTNATERGFEVKLSFSSTLNDYIQHRIAGFLGDVTFSSATNWSGTLTKTETDTGDFAEGAYELVLGYPSVLGNPSSVFSDKLFKCESYTYRAYEIISDVTYYGDYVAFDTLCDDGNNPGDDISEGDPTVPIIPIEPEPEIPPFEWEPEEDEPYPPWDWTPPEWNQPDYPGLDWTIDFYYRKPYTKKDLDELRKKCIIYNKNSIEFALVLRHNMNVLKEFFNMMTDYMSAEEYNDFTDLIPPQRLKELYLDPLNPVDFRDMINGFIRNTVDNNIAVNRNFKLIQDGLSDYETETDDAYFREITTSIKPLQQDNPDVERMKGLINNLNYEVASNFNEIMRNLEILRAKLL